MKTYVITVSQTFPSTHPKKGKPTLFKEKILNREKIHTIRLNYDFWKKRIDEVNEGKALISVRQWTGKPYNSQQKEYIKFYKGQVGIQKIEFDDYLYSFLIDDRRVEADSVIYNDGLDIGEFESWFRPIPITPSAIIHFTDFRY